MFSLKTFKLRLGRWCCNLERPRVAARLVLTILLIHSGLLAYSAYVHSPTLNEPGHLVAGLSHWEFNRYELYRVNPPLVRMVAALPVIAVGYKEDWSGFSERIGARPVFRIGEDIVVANGERSYFLFMVARWACMPFSWLGAIVCYLWARDLSGKPAGVMACLLWCFSPNILAHASLITADAHATALGLAACYTFWRWLIHPTWKQAAITGCVLGLAELAKTTLILFYPLWPILWIAYRWSNRKQMRLRDWLREAGMLLLRMFIGLCILNIGYDFEGSFKPLKDFHFISDLFTGTSEDDEFLNESERSTVNAPAINRFANSWLGFVPVPFPKNYLLGIDVQQSDFEDFHSPSYLGGQFQEQGWWYYYLYALAIKVPLGTWGLVVVFLLLRMLRPLASLRWRDELILLTPSLVIFVVVSSKTGFSHHMRYVLPCFPFVFIWLSQIAGYFLASSDLVNPDGELPSGIDSQRRSEGFIEQKVVPSASILTCILLAWSIGSSLLIYPHSLSYFNEITGGPTGGADHLLNSNIDWGQDLRYLKWWRDSRKTELHGEAFYLAYDGSTNPAALGFSDALRWPAERKDGSAPSLPSPGYYAISVNLLRGGTSKARDGQAGKVRLHEPTLQRFRSLEPYGRAGHSILIFKITFD